MNEIRKPEGPQLPASRAFVVQLSIEADVPRSRWLGRVEHVVSGKSTHFSSLDELIAFLAKVQTREPSARSASRDAEAER